MLSKLLVLFYLGCSLLFYSGGKYLSKAWTLKPSWALASSAIFVYTLGAILWLPALREHGQLSAVSVVWSLLSTIAAVGIGVYCFGEILSTRQIVGLVLAVIATILIF